MPDIMPHGEAWPDNNLTWEGFAVVGDTLELHSPIEGQLIQTVGVLTPQDLSDLFQFRAPLPTWAEAEVYAFALRLKIQLQTLAAPLKEATRLETAFSPAECDEIVEAALQYLEGFFDYYAAVKTPSAPELSYEAGTSQRKLTLTRVPWGTIAVMLPQNAVLFLGVVCLLNAFVTGNRIILRVPLQGARTAALLSTAVAAAQPASHSISIVAAKGREFLEAAYACDAPALIHYLGASQFGGDVLKNAFNSQKPALIDGTGNVWAWVSATSDAAQVAEMLTTGATRYNGQTCTSINGAIIHPSRYQQVCELLQQRWNQRGESEAPVPRLFDQHQARLCHQRISESGGRILSGGQCAGNVLEPALVENPSLDSDLVKEGIFGPVLWLRAGTEADFIAQWPSNHYPLCAAVFDPDAHESWWLARLPQLARLVLNGDPTIEHIYEPWGGYPSAGANAVSFWHQKYQRTVSLDKPSQLSDAL